MLLLFQHTILLTGVWFSLCVSLVFSILTENLTSNCQELYKSPFQLIKYFVSIISLSKSLLEHLNLFKLGPMAILSCLRHCLKIFLYHYPGISFFLFFSGSLSVSVCFSLSLGLLVTDNSHISIILMSHISIIIRSEKKYTLPVSKCLYSTGEFA